jgi:plastocyanin
MRRRDARLIATLSILVGPLLASPAAKAGTEAKGCASTWQVVHSGPASASSGLQDVAIISPDDVWAVSLDVEHWDGTAWSQVPSPNPDFLFAVDGVSPDDVWAVGYSDSTDPYIQHWDGFSWSPVTVSGPGTTFNDLFDIDARSSDDVWAVGTFGNTFSVGHPLVLHYDGSQWSAITAPDPAAHGSGLQGVAAIASDDVWAVGGRSPARTLTEHWDGVAWTVVKSPNATLQDALTAVSAISSRDVWAVGTSDGNTTTLTEHWNGTRWSVVPSPDGDEALFNVVAISHGDVWATSGDAFETLVEHWDGSVWEIANVPAREGDNDIRLSGIDATRTGELWAVGYGYGLYTTAKEHLCEIRVQDSGFVPATTKASMGAEVFWTLPASDASSHQLVDGDGLALIDSGSKKPGDSFGFTFEVAGSYTVEDSVSGAASTVTVAPRVSPQAGGVGTTFTITWATSIPVGYVIDAQIARPGEPFGDWKEAQMTSSTSFVPDAGVGTYQFRTRIRNSTTGLASDWSPSATIVVS